MRVHLLAPTVPVYTLEAKRPGPTAIVQAGIHGDEIAGVHALQELLEAGISIDAGKLLVVPVMNPPAYRARTRMAPGGADLNRCFPGDPDGPTAEIRLAAAFMDLMRTERPALVATLHESAKRYDPAVVPSFGQTIVYGVQPMPPVVGQVVERLNATRASDEEAWAAQYYPVATSSTEVIVDAIGCTGVCVETWMGFPERRRIEMHKEVVRTFLSAIGLVNGAW